MKFSLNIPRSIRQLMTGLLVLTLVYGPALNARTSDETPTNPYSIVQGATYRPERLGISLEEMLQVLRTQHEGNSLEDLFKPVITTDPKTHINKLVFRSTPVELTQVDSQGVSQTKKIQFEIFASEAATEIELQQFVREARKELGFSGDGLPFDLFVEMRSKWSERLPWMDRWIKKTLSKVSMQTVHTNEGSSEPQEYKRPVGLAITRVLANGTPTFVGMFATGNFGLAAIAGYGLVGGLSGLIMYLYREFQLTIVHTLPSLWMHEVFFGSREGKSGKLKDFVLRLYQSQDWIMRNIDVKKYVYPKHSSEFNGWQKWYWTEFAFATTISWGLTMLAPEVASAGYPFGEWIRNSTIAITIENLVYSGLGLWGQGTFDLAVTHEKQALNILNDRLLAAGEITREKHQSNMVRIQNRSNLQGALISFASVGTLGVGKVVPGMKIPSFIAFSMMGALGLIHYKRIQHRYPWYFKMLKEHRAEIPIEPEEILPAQENGGCVKAMQSAS